MRFARWRCAYPANNVTPEAGEAPRHPAQSVINS